MLFSSPVFFLFFGLYLLLHLLLPLRWRLALIIVGSAVFYGYWNPYYAAIPFAFIFVAYHGSIWMMAAAPGRPRRRRLAVVIATLLAPLLVVKYTGFVYNDVLGPLMALGGRVEPWPLPLGISFVTFTLIAYVVEIYQGRYRLERNRTMLAGLVLFFPHLIAGPILRPGELLPQLHHPKPGIGAHAVLGGAIFTLGFVKKVIFADSFAESVERVFAAGAAAGLTAADYLLGIYGFALQIYCDFSGYTDMAIGAAMILGVTLPTNFQRPYTSASIVEFWTRWHMTLSRWLRDYLYIPLGGNRRGYRRQMLNLVVTMALGGLWHGAHWTFVLWGLAHGFGIGFVHALRRCRPLQVLSRLPRPLLVLSTFHFVAASWILFRAPDLATAARVGRGPFVAPWDDVAAFASGNAFVLGLLAVFLVMHRWDDHQTVRRMVEKAPKAVVFPVLAIAWILAIALSQGSSAKFIYFDF